MGFRDHDNYETIIKWVVQAVKFGICLSWFFSCIIHAKYKMVGAWFKNLIEFENGNENLMFSVSL